MASVEWSSTIQMKTSTCLVVLGPLVCPLSLTNFIFLCIYVHFNLYVSNEWSLWSSLCEIQCHIVFLKFRLCARLCVCKSWYGSGPNNGFVWSSHLNVKSLIQGVNESIQYSVVHTNSNLYSGVCACKPIGTFNNFCQCLSSDVFIITTSLRSISSNYSNDCKVSRYQVYHA